MLADRGLNLYMWLCQPVEMTLCEAKWECAIGRFLLAFLWVQLRGE